MFRNGGAQSMFIVTADGVIATDPDMLALYQAASAEGKRLAQEGKCWDTAEKEFLLAGYENWPGYASGLPHIARRYCALWGRGFSLA